jgi:DNA recombination protein RmuC
VVKLKNVVIPIDAKYPRDDYMRYLESDTPEEKASCWNKFETAIKIQINSIEAKYIHPDKGTSEFALMFIPSEAIYYETIADTNHAGHPSSILRHAQDHHVMPVSPNTLYAFLQMIVLGIRNAEVIQGAKKLQEGLAALERHFELYYKKHQEIGKAIERASAAYRVGDGHIDRYKRSLDDTLRLDGLDQESVVDFPDRQEIEGTPA